MKRLLKDTGTLHFVGIGGIGMSGIAEIMCALGYKVQGSDIAESGNVKRLRALGISVAIGHAPENIGNNPAALVVSSAIRPDNVEWQAAQERKIPIVRRAEMLAELMRLKRAVAVGGTHGKTTTTSMIGQMLETAGFDPTIINGGIVNAYGTNIRLGHGDLMVVEADESDGTFTRLPAEIAVVTNINPEHMEHYGDFERVKEAYRRFILNIPFYGYAVLCLDHPEVQALIPDVTARRVVTYGFNPQADMQASNIRHDAGGSVFDVTFSPVGIVLRDVRLPMHGLHNVQNALAALCIAQQMNVAPPLMKKALETVGGVKRRFTKTGESGGITVIDDYGHHPVEIETVLKTARLLVADTGGRVVAVVQPHRYTRLHHLFEQFCTCFNEADTVIVADVYAAGETPIEGADRDSLVAGIRKHGHRHVLPLADKNDLPRIVAEEARPGDTVVCLGAGDITQWAYDLPGQLEMAFEKTKENVA